MKTDNRYEAALGAARAALRHELEDLHLTNAERRTFLWLEGWEPEVIDHVVNVLRAARAAGRRAAAK